ncbi:MAG: Smr/MutS family protein [SAR324 cluster bacterium]|nr:Smr/MutS family protein [SAR324 cluster bacterium]HIF70144.1 hypothetical protein [Candidatus Lambdaproteobacteria bacterium]
MGHKPPSGLSFEFSADDDRLMESALRNSELPDGDPDELPGDLLISPRKSKRKSSPKHPDETIDLHGKTQEEAIRMVQNFVKTSHTHGLRNVLIITGKGLHSGTQGPVLKHSVEQWLQRNGTPYLQEFHDAPPRHGGSGAIWVRLK